MYLLQDRDFWIDGGSMFGLIPRVLWSRVMKPDALNRIRLVTNSVLLQRGGDWMLIEAGIGDVLPKKEAGYVNLQPQTNLIDRLRERGVRPEDIRWLVLTHLHYDHSGWCTRPDGQGGFVPTFPNAEYIVQASQLGRAFYPSRRDRGSYMKQSLEPVQRAGLWKPVQGIVDVAGDVRLLPTGGHTPGHQVVLFEEAGRTHFYTGDLIPTTRHLGPAYGIAYDADAETVVAQKQRFLTRACDEAWQAVWCHDPDRPVTRVVRDERGELTAAE